MPDCRTDSAAAPRNSSRARDLLRRPDRTRPSRLLSVTGLAIVLMAAGASGCASLDPNDESAISRLLNTGRIRGPLERSLYDDDSPLALGKKYSPEAKREVDAATAKFEKGDYKTAAKEFKAAAKKYKESSIGEEAQYRLAECYYAMGELPKAQDAFDQLFADYPSTRYVEPTTRRLFAIAKQWLEISDPVAKNEIRQVSGESVVEEKTPAGPPRDPTLRYRILPNFHDGSRPVFDTQGRALQSLKAIWLNDPTGPLADDALMLTATYYHRRRNYVEADRYFKILREEYPQSPHFQASFELGSHVKLMSYQGPYYEGADLTTAGKLKEQTLHLFPTSENRQQTRKDLDKVYLLQAQRSWSRVEYYQKKRKPKAVAIACMNLITEYPDTRFAAEARQILRGIDPKDLDGLPEVASFIQSLPAAPPGSLPESADSSPVKSVSDSRAESPEQGKVRL